MQILPISDIARAATGLPTATKGFMSGLNFAQQAQKQALLNKILGVQQQYAEPMAKAGLEKTQLANTLAQMTNKYFPQTTEANIKNKLAQAVLDRATGELRTAQIKGVPSEIALRTAQAKTLPVKTLASLASGLGSYGKMKQSFMPGYILSRLANSPQLLSLISTNPAIAKSVAQGFSNIATQAPQAFTGTSQTPFGQDIIQQMAKGMGINIAPQVVGTTQVQPSPIATTVTEADVKNMARSAGDALQRKTTTAKIINQRQYAGILSNLFNTSSSLMPSVSKYAGLAGQGQKGLDALKSAFGDTSPEYNNYLKFTRGIAPILSNEMRRTLGGQASDNEQKIMANLANPTYWDNNPQQAMQQFDFIRNVYERSVNPALASSPSETLANLKETDIRPFGIQTGKLRSFNNVQDAVNANLPEGTIVLIGGRRAKIKPRVK